MEPKVYRYRLLANVFLPGFLTLWSVALLFAVLTQGPRGHLERFPRETPDQARFAFWLLLAIGFPIAGVAFRLLLGWLNERVEFAGEELRWFDWRGRERIRARLSEIQAVRTEPSFLRRNFRSLENLTIRTDKGEIPVSGTIWGYEDLKTRVFEAWERNRTGV